MLKSFLEFMVTGIALVAGYFLYAVGAFLATVVIGLPIAIGIKFIMSLITILASTV